MGCQNISLERILNGKEWPSGVALQVNASLKPKDLKNTGINDEYLFGVVVELESGTKDYFRISFLPGQSQPGLKCLFQGKLRVLQDSVRTFLGLKPSYSRSRINLFCSTLLDSPDYDYETHQITRFGNIETTIAKAVAGNLAGQPSVTVDTLNKRVGGYHTTVHATIMLDYELTQGKIAELVERIGTELKLRSITANYYKVPINELKSSNLPPKKTCIQNSGIFI